MQRVRAQAAAAAASGANTLVQGLDATQVAEIARAIHYRRYPEGEQGLLELDAHSALPSQLGRLVQQLLGGDQLATLLIEGVDSLSAEQQFELLTAMARPEWRAQVIATRVQTDIGNDADHWDPPTSSGLSDELQAALSTLVVEVPPLAERPEDLPELAHWYLADMVAGTDDAPSAIDDDALDMLMIYTWPGEQTELGKVLISAAGRAREGTITARHLPKLLHHAVDRESLAVDRPQPIDLDDYLSRVESALVTRALELAGGNKAEAARLLGVSRPRLYRKLEQMGLLEPAAGKPKPETTPTDVEPAVEPVVEESAAAIDQDDIEFLPVDPE